MADKYLILDSRGIPLASGEADGGEGREIWTVQVAEEELPKVLDHELVRLVGSSPQIPAVDGRVLRGRGRRVEIQILKTLGEDVRQNLRMPARFDTFLYPVTGGWTGRQRIISHDLSCGGIAFFCARELQEGEEAEVVIPLTAQPLILRIQILRRRPSAEVIPLYAARFQDLIPQQEAMIREAVFGLQIRTNT